MLFLYRQVLQVDLPYIEDIEQAKRPERLPVVFTRSEVKQILAHLDGVNHLVASLLYGSSLRRMEGLRLRVKRYRFGAPLCYPISGAILLDTPALWKLGCLRIKIRFHHPSD